MDTITSKNPGTNEQIATLEQTPLEIIPQIIQQARTAQSSWAQLTPKQRASYFYNAREFILDQTDSIASLISKENGKPHFEAIVNDILPALDLLSIYTKKAPKLLKDKQIKLHLMKHKNSYLNFWPKGVVLIISPWNYPFSIPFGEIVLALLSGNAVVFKPSEATPLIGLKISEIFEQACLPKNLLQVVLGDGSRGAALVKSKVDKIFFTGSVQTGKRVMAAASENLTPVVLELGGKDPMIVMPDADLDFATSAALWGGFSNSGQACASVERIIVHDSIHDEFVSKLNEKLKQLKHSRNLESADLGYITYEKQKEIYTSQLQELSSENSKVVSGGKFSENRSYLEATIVTNPDNANYSCPLENTKIYNEETFGPVVAITKFKTTQEAIDKANNSRFGLLSSIISKDIHRAETIAKQIEAGSVLINEVMYTHGLAETPWGGIKESGFGRVHSDFGFLEFVNMRHIHKPKWWSFQFKSLWWFPYTKIQLDVFRAFMELAFRRSLIKKIQAFPKFIVTFIQMIKSDKRL